MCSALRRLRRLTKRQTDDDGLWFEPKYVTEAYLMRELRVLHDAIEKSKCECEEVPRETNV